MPGHPVPPISPASVEQARKHIATATALALVDAHAAVFFLIDSLESHWLLTVLECVGDGVGVLGAILYRRCARR